MLQALRQHRCHSRRMLWQRHLAAQRERNLDDTLHAVHIGCHVSDGLLIYKTLTGTLWHICWVSAGV